MTTVNVPSSQLIQYVPVKVGQTRVAKRVEACGNATVGRLSEIRYLMIYEAYTGGDDLALASCLLDEELSVVPGSNAVLGLWGHNEYRLRVPSIGILRDKLVLRVRAIDASLWCTLDFDYFWHILRPPLIQRDVAFFEIDGVVLSTGDEPIEVGATCSVPLGSPFGDSHCSMACGMIRRKASG